MIKDIIRLIIEVSKAVVFIHFTVLAVRLSYILVYIRNIPNKGINNKLKSIIKGVGERKIFTAFDLINLAIKFCCILKNKIHTNNHITYIYVIIKIVY